MTQIQLPYGNSYLNYDFDDNELKGILGSRIEQYKPDCSSAELVEDALASPIGSKPLCELAQGKQKVVLLASDHSRPVPSKFIVPPMLREIRKGNPTADITILIATGFHRGTTRDELVNKFGAELVKEEKIVVHDCYDDSQLVDIGPLPSGRPCFVNRLALEADLVVSEGFIEPHFFAGFSGGRKSVLPGISGHQTVLEIHCADLVGDPHARAGVLDGNPMHGDMLWAAQRAGLEFIVNVIINAEKQPIFAVAGDLEEAHKAGRGFLMEHCQVEAIPCDIAVVTNGGYPLDQNIYQAVKGMTAAEATVRQNGVIIMLAESIDGHGGNAFFETMSAAHDTKEAQAAILARSPKETIPDQWESQVFLRVLNHARVVYVSGLPDDLITSMQMIPASSIDEALALARQIVQKDQPEVVVIPDGVAVVVV